MRTIKTKDEIEKKRRRNQIIGGGVLIAVMLLSTLGYSFLQNGDSNSNSNSVQQKYNGFTFVNQNNLWQVQIGSQVYGFYYPPNETESVSVSENLSLISYSNKPLYIVNQNAGAGEIVNNLGRYTQRYQQACVSGENCSSFPIKTCDDNLIIFENGTSNEVKQNKNCIYIYGDSLKGADAFLYKLVGVRA